MIRRSRLALIGFALVGPALLGVGAIWPSAAHGQGTKPGTRSGTKLSFGIYRHTDPDLRWVRATDRTRRLGPKSNPFILPKTLPVDARGKPRTLAGGRLFPRFLRVRGVARPLTVMAVDLGSGFSIEAMGLYEATGGRRLVGVLSSLSRGIRRTRGVTYRAGTDSLLIEYEGEPALVVPARELRGELRG